MIIPDGDSILFTGDSITDAQRARPVGEDAKDWLGSGYVATVASIMEAWQPGHRRRIRNTGISGNTVVDLQQRWQTDVLDLKPDWLSIMIGINDCARAFHRPLISEGLVSVSVYRTTLSELLASIRPQLAGLVLMTPFYVDSSMADPLRLQLHGYADVVKELGQQHEAIVVDTQAAFDTALTKVHACRLSGDSVHPNPTGHMILARAWLNAVGFDWAGSS